ncbi:MAG: hypothetical protein ABH812_02910 [bacterium]
MYIAITFITIAIISIFLAYFSMRDMEIPNEVKRIINKKRLNGTVLFLKKKIMHYSSSSSSLSSEE